MIFKWEEKKQQFSNGENGVSGCYFVKAEVFWNTDYSERPARSGYKAIVYIAEKRISSRGVFGNMEEAKGFCEKVAADRIMPAFEQLKDLVEKNKDVLGQ